MLAFLNVIVVFSISIFLFSVFSSSKVRFNKLSSLLYEAMHKFKNSNIYAKSVNALVILLE